MDGKNQTIIIAFNSSFNTHDTVIFTLDYQTQMLYWVDSYSNTLESSNVDGTNRQILLITSDIEFYHGVSLFRDILLLSGSYSKIYMASTSGQNFQLMTASLNCVSSIYQPPILKVISQEEQPNNCKTMNTLELCIHWSYVYTGVMNTLELCIAVLELCIAVLASSPGSPIFQRCTLKRLESLGTRLAMYLVELLLYNVLIIIDTNPCGTTNGGCSHFCLLSAMDLRGYSCDCPKGMMLDSNKQSCTGTATSSIQHTSDSG